MVSKRNSRTDEQRRRIMQAVRGKDTKLEILVRRLVHGMGYRYRLHRRDLPGSPDLVFGPRRKVIFIHGCFWHHHQERGCPISHLPSFRREYWQAKFAHNTARDQRQEQELRDSGWQALVLWECEIRGDKDGGLEQRIREYLA